MNRARKPMLRFSLGQMLAVISVIAIALGIVSYGSPTLVAIGCDVFALYLAVSEAIARRFKCRYGYIRSPKDVLEWVLIVVCVLLVNGAAFGPVTTSRR